MTTAQAVEAEHLVKVYPGEIHAVRDISFSVSAGESFGLLGPNGAGKSTTIGMLSTTVTPTSGRARLGGRDVARDPTGTRAISSVVFQDSVLDRPLTGRQNLTLHLRLWRVARDAGRRRLEEMAAAAGIDDSLTGLLPPTAADSGAAWRSCGHCCPRPRCCSSTSQRWAWTPGSATTCSTRSPRCASAPA